MYPHFLIPLCYHLDLSKSYLYNAKDDIDVLVFQMYSDWINWNLKGVDSATFTVPPCTPSSDNSPFAFFRNLYPNSKRARVRECTSLIYYSLTP